MLRIESANCFCDLFLNVKFKRAESGFESRRLRSQKIYNAFFGEMASDGGTPTQKRRSPVAVATARQGLRVTEIRTSKEQIENVKE